MINFFQPASGDKSIEYLGTLFGSMNGLLPGGELSLLGTMFKTFNSTILAIAALVLVYVTVIGVMKTAHEGEFMGKNWSNLWLPIRSVLGIAMMVPTGSGYSGLQIVMMWVVLQGIGAADTLWNTALSYVNIVGTPYAQVSIPGVGAIQPIQALFQGLTCDATARETREDPTKVTNGGYFCATQSNKICNTPLTFDPSATQLSLGPDGTCGTLKYCNTAEKCTEPNSIECLACKAQGDVLTTIVPVLAGIGTELARADFSYRDFLQNSSSPAANKSGWQWIYNYCADRGIPQQNCCVQSDSPFSTCKQGSSFPDPNASIGPQNASAEVIKNVYWKFWPQLEPNLGADVKFIQTAVGFYMDAANKAYTSYIQSAGNESIDGKLGEAQVAGWMFAGGYYYAVANHTGGKISQALPPLTWEPADMASGTMSHYRNNYSAAVDLINAAVAAAGSWGGNQAAEGAVNLVNSSMETIKANFETSIQGAKSGPIDDTNPLYGIQAVGVTLMVTAEALFIALFIAIVAVSIIGNVSIFVAGTGVTNPLAASTYLVVFFLLPAVYALIGYLISLGGLLSVYVPLIPYIVFTFGAIGWLISVIEMMVAGPLVALGVISPSGHHEILGKSEPALMLLFNVFLRPSLMIFGLMAAMLLAVIVVKFINGVFWGIVTTGITEQVHFSSLLTFLMLIGAWVMLLVAALNKCFSAINVIPQQVMRWVSGQGEAVEAPLGEIKGGVEAVGGGTQGAAGGMKSGAEAGGRHEKERQAEVRRGDSNTSVSGNQPKSSPEPPEGNK
ncbi:MAG: DotA/TraY family protein [Gammaproteobacteria bacterium]|nr:DotA/TraY family protein [Gammaproteobacteria bacterium]MCW5583286.1 DotA/TraY family protein [Gammaproteobacteria bacterium]